MTGRIVIVSGAPGAGKSTVARALAMETAADRAAHLHTDDFYAYVRKGLVSPWLPEAMDQNITLMRAIAAAAAAYAVGGYEAVVDGIVGPWFFDPWREAAAAHGLDLRYVCLQAGEDETVARAVARRTGGAMTDPEVVRLMWQGFQRFPPPPGCIVDTARQAPAATAAAIRDGLAAGRFRLA